MPMQSSQFIIIHPVKATPHTSRYHNNNEVEGVWFDFSNLLDHIIIGDKRFTSLVEAGYFDEND